MIQFVIGKDGNISGIRTRGPDPILEKEAVRGSYPFFLK